MAKQQIVEYFDDVDGKPVDEEDHHCERFALGGKVYEIDLRTRNRDALYKALAKYTEAARVVGKLPEAGPYLVRGKGAAAGKAKRATPEDDPRVVREWARNNGWPLISNRGRIPAEVSAAYATREQRAAADPNTKSRPARTTTKRTEGKKRVNGAELPPRPEFMAEGTA